MNRKAEITSASIVTKAENSMTSLGLTRSEFTYLLTTTAGLSSIVNQPLPFVAWSLKLKLSEEKIGFLEQPHKFFNPGFASVASNVVEVWNRGSGISSDHWAALKKLRLLSELAENRWLCAYTRAPLNYGALRTDDDAPSFDHVIPTLRSLAGLSRSPIKICAHRINKMKAQTPWALWTVHTPAAISRERKLAMKFASSL